MGKYRIRVEMIEGEDREGFEKAYAEGVECTGFAILAKDEDGHESMIHGVSQINIATMIASNSEIRAAAAIAEGMVKAGEIRSKGRIEEKFSALFSD